MKTNVSFTSKTRRSLLVTIGSLPLMALTIGKAFAAKVSQKAVAYQAEPKGAFQCSNCRLFQAPNACVNVEGPVVASGWCRIWVKAAT